ncbi:LysR family transcriptional regulator [Leptospira interrogans]
MLSHRQMEMLSAIMRHGSMTSAAQVLGLSQPALSRQLKRAEDRLGYPLFNRVRGRLEPTIETRILYREIARLERDIHGLQSLAAELAVGGAGLLRIGASSSLSATVLPGAIQRFRKLCPGVKIVAHARPVAQLEELVVAREIDIGMALSPVKAPNAAVHLEAPVEMVCICGIDHPLAVLDIVRPQDINPFELVSYGSDTYFGAMLDTAFQSEGLTRRIDVEVWSAMLTVPLVIESGAVAIIDSLLARQIEGRVAVRPFAPTVAVPFSLFTAAAALSGGAAARFVECVEQCMADRNHPVSVHEF